MAAGSIVIDLLMKTGSFETDTKRAEKRLKEMQKTAEKAGAAIGLAIVGGITAAVVAFDQLNKGAADFQDTSEMIGDSAENVASMAVSLATAGVSMESFASASIKLSKGLVGVDDESKAVGAALKFLNINIEEFKKLSPVAQYEAIAQALAKVTNEQDKVALATSLFGKAGAEQLKVMKALVEAGGRQSILTQEQIQRADAYADAQARNSAIVKLYAQVIATELLPAFNDLVEAGTEVLKALLGIDKAGAKVDGKEIREFADGVATAFAFVVDQLDLVVRLFEIAGKTIGGSLAVNNALIRGEFKEAVGIYAEMQKDLQSVVDRQTFGDKLRSKQNARKTAEANPASYSNEGRAPTPIPGARFEGPEKAARAEKQSDAEKYIKTLEDQLQTTQELTALEKLWDDVGKGRLGTLTTQQMVVLDGLAAQIDAQKELIEQRKEDERVLSMINKRVGENYENAQRLAQSVETPAEHLSRTLKEINAEAAKNPFLDQETQVRLTAQAWKDYEAAVDKAKDKTDTFADQAARNIQDALGSSVQDALQGNFDNILKNFKNLLLRMASEAIAADIGRKLLGENYAKTGKSDGWLSQLFSAAGSYFGSSSSGSSATIGGGSAGGYVNPVSGQSFADGGRPPVGMASLVGERGPEMFVPSTQGRIIPNELLGQGGGSNVEIVNPPGIPLRGQIQEKRNGDGRMSKRVILQTIMEDANAGGSAITTIAGKLGTPRNLQRRGR